jgi:AcrR family transcriptional regulator
LVQERNKRERILEAAQVVFARKGYFQAKVEEIAELAEVGKGTVYEYFPSKQELYKEMFKSIIDRYTQVVMADLEEATVEARIRYWIEMHLRYMLDNRQHTPQNFGDMGGIDEELLTWMHNMHKEGIKRMKVMFEKGIAQGELKEIDPELVANLFAGLLKGITVPLMMENTCDEPQKVAAEVADVLLKGLLR